MQHLRELDAHRDVPLVPVVRVDLVEHGIRIEILRKESRPRRAWRSIAPRSSGEAHVVLADERGAITARDEQVPGVTPDEMAQRVEDRAVGPRDVGLQLLRAELEARSSNRRVAQT